MVPSSSAPSDPNTQLLLTQQVQRPSNASEGQARHSRDNADVSHDRGPVPVIQNVVGTCNLGVKVDLKHIAMRARNAEYNPRRFAAAVMRIREPRTTALVFSSGKIVVTGAKSEEACNLAARKYAKIALKLGYDKAKCQDFKVRNMVGSCEVNFPIQLERLAHEHYKFCTYEPELFPGIVYRMIEPKIVLMIFASGKVILTGGKCREDLRDAFENIYAVLKSLQRAKN